MAGVAGQCGAEGDDAAGAGAAGTGRGVRGCDECEAGEECGCGEAAYSVAGLGGEDDSREWRGGCADCGESGVGGFGGEGGGLSWWLCGAFSFSRGYHCCMEFVAHVAWLIFSDCCCGEGSSAHGREYGGTYWPYGGTGFSSLSAKEDFTRSSSCPPFSVIRTQLH